MKLVGWLLGEHCQKCILGQYSRTIGLTYRQGHLEVSLGPNLSTPDDVFHLFVRPSKIDGTGNLVM